MSETYDEIINEIDRCKYVCDFFGAERNNCEICSQHENCFRSSSKSIAARVREAVGGDPSEWYVLDADGNKVHKDDTVKLGVSEFKVICVGITNGKPSFCYRDNDGWLYIACAHKVVPDTREKIIENTLATLELCCVITPTVKEAVEKAIDRAMKLSEVDE